MIHEIYSCYKSDFEYVLHFKYNQSLKILFLLRRALTPYSLILFRYII